VSISGSTGPSHAAGAQDLCEKSPTDVLAAMHGDNGAGAVGVTQETMAAADADDLEAELAQCGHRALARQRGQPGQDGR